MASSLDSSHYGKSTRRMIGEYSEGHLLKRAAEVVTQKTEGSTIFDQDAEDRIPRFAHDELELGRVLGRGGFCVVSEVKKITLQHDDENGETDDHHHHHDDEDDYMTSTIVQDRKFMETYCIRKGNHARYAIKQLSESTRTKDPHTFINGIVDLAVEARFLAVIRHPNIIKMRAVAQGDPFNSHFFVVLDRLYDTLTQRFVKWKKKGDGSGRGIRKLLLDRKGKGKIEFWLERITVAYDLASALKYLHALNIIYRDLKPDNIGFDVRGDVKIFDFGLARELNPDLKVPGKNTDVYKLTGDTGSLRYMAPEVAVEKPYNETVDCFSMAVLLWQICAIETPYEGYTMNMFQKKVIRGGVRPKVDPKWPEAISTMMKNAWGTNIAARPSMEEMAQVLRDEINSVSDEDVHDLVDVSRKSAQSLSTSRKSGRSSR